MKNNTLGFAFLPVLIGIGLLMIGGATGVIVTKKVNTASNESAIVTVQDNTLPEILIEETNESSIDEEITNELVTTDLADASAVTNSQITSHQSLNSATVTTNNQIKRPTSEPVVTASTHNVTPTINKEAELATEATKQHSKSLTSILNETRKIAESKKATNDKALATCKNYYDSEVKRIESMWESDLRSYEQQKSWNSSNSGLYDMVGTTNSNNQYLQDKYDESKSRKDTSLKSAKSTYDSCVSNYKRDTSLDKDISKIASEQRNLMDKLTNNNAQDSLIKIKNLIQEAEKLKYKLMLTF